MKFKTELAEKQICYDSAGDLMRFSVFDIVVDGVLYPHIFCLFEDLEIKEEELEKDE